MRARELRSGSRQFTGRTLPGGQVEIDGRRFTVERVAADAYLVREGTQQWRVFVAGTPPRRWAAVNGHVLELEEVGAGGPAARPRPRGAGHEEMAAPMPATVRAILVEPGAAVVRGQTVLMLEAMKMELAIRAPRDGIVQAVHCRTGDLVQAGEPLVEIE